MKIFQDFKTVYLRGTIALLIVLSLVACGGSGGNSGSPSDSTPLKSSVFSSSSSSISPSSSLSSVNSSLSPSSISSSLSSSNSSSLSSSSSNSPMSSFLMGGAIQGTPLNIATVVTTFAGAALGADGTGTSARFNWPSDMVSDGTNLYVADADTNTIRKIVISTGVVTTLAGKAGVNGSADGTGTAARFTTPVGITLDNGNLYVTDNNNHTVRKIVITTGEVTTIAGTAHTTGSINGAGAAALFFYPSGITSDGTNLYVADSSNRLIRKIVIATGVVTTLAGAGIGSVDGVGIAAKFEYPVGITIDNGNLYVSDSFTIRKIVIPTGVVSTFAGKANSGGSTDGISTTARFQGPAGMTTDGTNLYVADGGNKTIRQIVIASGVVTTLAGTPSVSGNADGSGTEARFGRPRGITAVGSNLYVSDSSNNTIRKILASTGAVTTLAGTSSNSADGTGAAVGFSAPYGITTDGANLYVADYLNNTVRKIVISTGLVTTPAGTAGTTGSADGTGAAANFHTPSGITTDGTNLYVADTGNNTIRRIVISSGVVTTLAGTAGTSGSADGTGIVAQFDNPTGITTDGTNLYVADTGNNTIRKIAILTGVVTTFAGTAGTEGSTDGTGAMARFNSPNAITTDGTNLYLNSNNAIRKVVISTRLVTTLAGTADTNGSADGIGAAASFQRPSGITTDGKNLYVCDAFNSTIRKIVISTGLVTTLAGTAGTIGNADGSGNAASFDRPIDITTNGVDLFVTDVSNNTIRKIH